MTMVIDNQGRHYGGMGYDQMYPSMQQSPHFNDPWSQQTNHTSPTYSSLSKPETSRPAMSLPYSHIPVTSAPLASGSNYSALGYGSTDVLNLPQDMSRSSYGEPQYSSPATSATSYVGSYPSLGYAQSLHQQQQQQQQHQQQRKLSDHDNSRVAAASFGELDASRGMLALSHQSVEDLTPRNIFEARAPRTSTDAYGFPPSHSAHSSISNESGRGYPYYGSSVASTADSATDYSSAASDAGYDMPASRTLPRPSQLMGAALGPPAPQSMMGQFSSKMSANTQKKHKCKVCDKRFTRPSSLQTHMYSHTGEKPFACNVEGCGRHFSVVSNLRRHKKVHKGESVSSHSDDED